MKYTLRDDGYGTFKKIMHGAKNWVGRVVTHAEGQYVGIITEEGVTKTFRAPTEVGAFKGVVAEYLGEPHVRRNGAGKNTKAQRAKQAPARTSRKRTAT